MIATYFISDCQDGYYWDNCSRTCPYPHYGNRCRQKCSCLEKLCDFMTGCKKGKYITFRGSTFLSLTSIFSLINEKLKKKRSTFYSIFSFI